MAHKMLAHLPQIDLQKMETILDIETRFLKGQISFDEAREQLTQRVGSFRPYHLAFIEQTMTLPEDDECLRENIAQKLQLFEGLLDHSRPSLPDGHPIAHYYAENDAFRDRLLAVEDLVQYPVIKNQWYPLLDEIKAYGVHFSRKQNQLYTLLERKGFDRPTTTMWTFDDAVRDLIRECRELIDQDDEENFIAHCKDLVYYGRDLMQKEETILYPTSLAMITEAEFEDMKSGDQEIGFAYIQVEHQAPSATPAAEATPSAGFAAELQQLLSKYGYSAGKDDVLDVTTGKLTLEQINLIYKHLPIDISYVDENEIVCFYSDTDHRIFPRSKNVIGREVINCHPRKSAHVVREVIDKLRSGEQDRAEFWINKPEVFLYIVYVAVRDKEGRFRGVLEMMQDCTRIRAFEGSQTLLKWANDEGIPAEAPQAENQDTAPQTETPKPQSEAPTAPAAADAPLQLTTETRLFDLFDQYPELRNRMTEISPLFAMLKTPFGKLLAKKADLLAASERSGVPLERIIAGIQRIVGEIRAKQ